MNYKAVRLGKGRAKQDTRTLRLSRYLKLDKLPPLPLSDDNASKVSVWPMDGNDIYGNCVLAANEHSIRGWTTYAGSPKYISEQDVINLYLQMSPRDEGLIMLDTLNTWRKIGLWNNKIDSYVALDIGDLTQAKYAINLFGYVNIGMSLPNINTFGPWTNVTGPANYYNGHAVILTGYDDSTRMFKAITWGEVVDLSYDWYQAYVDEAYAILTKDWFTTTGVSPDGFDWNTLQSDLDLIVGKVPPTPDPTPQPEPDPIPPEPVTPTKNWLWVILSAIGLGLLALFKFIF